MSPPPFLFKLLWTLTAQGQGMEMETGGGGGEKGLVGGELIQSSTPTDPPSISHHTQTPCQVLPSWM